MELRAVPALSRRGLVTARAAVAAVRLEPTPALRPAADRAEPAGLKTRTARAAASTSPLVADSTEETRRRSSDPASGRAASAVPQTIRPATPAAASPVGPDTTARSRTVRPAAGALAVVRSLPAASGRRSAVRTA